MSKPLWTSDEIAAATGGALSGPAFAVGGVSIDTRSIETGDLFVALAGARDGPEFVPQALAAGAAASLASRNSPDCDSALATSAPPILASNGTAWASTCAAADRTGLGSAGLLAAWVRSAISGASPPWRAAACCAVWARICDCTWPGSMSMEGAAGGVTGITGRTGVTGIATWGVSGPWIGVIDTGHSPANSCRHITDRE